ncbi:MAG: hypothetical protein A4E73_00302 [Syntrophaceae bacterium PtaU1.Bin231]|nr:MAG: hypothetical protein A4E73_00302 [Syntrophaceae bacterium PtaU1.Bin231]
MILHAPEIDAHHHVQRQVGGEDVVHRVQDREIRALRVGRDRSARHPVMAVEDELPLVAAPHGLDDIVDHLPLKFRGREEAVTIIGAEVLGENGGTDQVDPFRRRPVAQLPPLAFVEPALLTEPPLEVQRRQMHVDPPVDQPLAECGDHLSLSTALSRDVLREIAHFRGKLPRFRSHDHDSGLFLPLEDLETLEGHLQVIDLPRQKVCGPHDGTAIRVEIGVHGVVLADALVKEVDVIGGRQVAPLRPQFLGRGPRVRLHGLDVLEQFVLGIVAQPAEGVPARVRPGRCGQVMDVEDRAIGVREFLGHLAGVGHDDGLVTCKRIRQALPEVEDPLLFPDVLSDMFVVVAEQHGFAVDLGDMSCIGLRADPPVREAEGDVVAEIPVAGDDDQVGALRPEDGVRRNGLLPFREHVVPLFAQDGEISHVRDDFRDPVVVHEFGVPERRRKDTEHLPHPFAVQ